MRRALLAAALLTSLASSGYAQSTSTNQQGIAVSNAWARASAGAATTGAAYFTVTDSSATDRLVGASTPVAGKAELHETRNENGVMQMRAVPALALEPGKPVTLMPGGYHVMLTELKQPLKAGDEFPLTLTFDKAAPITVHVKVSAAGATESMHGMHGMAPMGGNKP
jgi:periplasmic copper chaperone A